MTIDNLYNSTKALLESNKDYIIESLDNLKFCPQLSECFYTDDNDEEQGLDVRLRVNNFDVTILYGDSDFDVTHTGFWGFSVLYQSSDTKELATELIKDLLDCIELEG